MFYFVLFYKSRIQHEGDISFVDICLGDIVTKPNLRLLAQHTAESICWHQVVVKESTAFIAGHQARRMGLRSELVRERVTGLVHGSLIGCWWGNRVVFWESHLSTFCFQPQSGVHMLVVSMQQLPSGGGFSICKTAQGYGSGCYL